MADNARKVCLHRSKGPSVKIALASRRGVQRYNASPKGCPIHTGMNSTFCSGKSSMLLKYVHELLSSGDRHKRDALDIVVGGRSAW